MFEIVTQFGNVYLLTIAPSEKAVKFYCSCRVFVILETLWEKNENSANRLLGKFLNKMRKHFAKAQFGFTASRFFLTFSPVISETVDCKIKVLKVLPTLELTNYSNPLQQGEIVQFDLALLFCHATLRSRRERNPLSLRA